MTDAPMTAAEAAESIAPLLNAFRGLQRASEMFAMLAAIDQEAAERRRVADAALAEEQATRDRIAEEIERVGEIERESRARIAADKAEAEASLAVQRNAVQDELDSILNRTRAAQEAHDAAVAANAAVMAALNDAAREANERHAAEMARMAADVDAKRAAAAEAEGQLAAVEAARAAILAKLAS